MKAFIIRAAFLFFILVPIAHAALVRLGTSDAMAAADSIHLTNIPKSMGFGRVKKVTSKSIKIKNNGTASASVTLVPPSAPFAVSSGGGSFTLVPKGTQLVTIEFAPQAAGTFTSTMTIQCGNCSDAAQTNIAIDLKGSAKSAVGSPSPSPSATPTPTDANALPFSINHGPFGDSVDMPYVSVKICANGTSNCSTIGNVLVDTGSFGLRVFASQLSGLDITPNINGGSQVGECAFFGAGSTWGAVSAADVYIAGEPKITVPIQVIDDTGSFASAPHDCSAKSQLITSPQAAQFDGLLGIGQFGNDVIFTDYYDCSSENCSALAQPPSADIVVNPVASYPVDNNGIVVDLPAVAAGGSASAQGTIYFGIGTQTNNQPGSVVTLAEDSDVSSNSFLDINTVFGGTTAGAFFDTGSNGYFFDDGQISQCSKAEAPGFYCPPSLLTESATNESVDGSVSDVVNFDVDNAMSLFNSGGAAFDDLGGGYDGGDTYDGFDWGLPFFFGRVVYMGLAGASSPLGTGPYIAY
jgi:hypothetical protein